MTFSIDSVSYDKHKKYPTIDKDGNGHGYEVRHGLPSSVVVHSTEGGRGQTLKSAAEYLYNTAKVSADFLVGRGGEIYQFLDSARYAAWHAGVAQAAWQNQKSIGIECLHSQGDNWPPVQKDALAWLLKRLMPNYSIPLTLIDTHGQVAIKGPYGRKVDPTDWTHADFIQWRNALAPSFPTLFLTNKPTTIYQDSAATKPIGSAVKGTLLLIDGARYGAAGTGHISKTSMNFADLGFVRLADLDEVK